MYVLVVTLLGARLANTQPQTTTVLDVYGNKGSFLNPGYPQDTRELLDLVYTGHFIYSHPQWVRLTMEYLLDGTMPACIDYIHVIGQNYSRCGKVSSQREQFVQEGGMLQMTAYSANKQSRKGFNVTYEVLGVLDLYTNAGSFTSPNFPNTYWDDLDLNYTAHLTTPGPQLLHIILDTDLEIQISICYDFITLFFQNKIVKYCGPNNLAFDAVVDGDKLQMSFHTDYSIGKRGFNVTYYVIGPFKTTSISSSSAFLWDSSFPWTQTCTTCHVPAPSSTLFTDWTDGSHATDPALSTEFTTATLLTNLTLSTSVTSPTLSTALTNLSDGAAPMDNYKINGIDPTTTDSLASYGTRDNNDVIVTQLELTTRDEQPPDDVSSSYITPGDVGEGWPGGNLKVTVPFGIASSWSTTGLTPSYSSPQSIEIIARQDMDVTATIASEMKVLAVDLQTQTTTSDVEALATITSDTDMQTIVTSDMDTLTSLTSNMEIQAIGTITGDTDMQTAVTRDMDTLTTLTSNMETQATFTSDTDTQTTATTNMETLTTLTSNVETLNILTSNKETLTTLTSNVETQANVTITSDTDMQTTVTTNIKTQTTLTSNMETLNTLTSKKETLTTLTSNVETMTTLISNMKTQATITSDTYTQTTVTTNMETQTTLTSNMETLTTLTSNMETPNVVTSDSTTQTIAASDTETTLSVTGDKKTSDTPWTALDPVGCCRCQLLGQSDTGNAEDREKKIDEIIATLLVDKDNVSSTKRKHISAHDSRQSAAALGLVGVVLCALPMIFVLLMDVAGLAAQAACGKKSMRAKNTVDAS